MRAEIFSVTVVAVQGNCKSVDSTGARWCYVDSHHSSCQDLRFSARFPSNPWSYEACATPLPYAPLAPVVPPHNHVPSAAYTVPVQQVQPVHPVHSHPVHPVHSHPVHSHPQPVYGSNTGTLPADYLGKISAERGGEGRKGSLIYYYLQVSLFPRRPLVQDLPPRTPSSSRLLAVFPRIFN